ncbi:MAG: response regulator [Magnetococcales bacterium]|nr:response regulator [Magnetococcales bacterium]
MVTVLVIDDNDSFRDVMRQILERVGYQVVTAHNGQHGLEQFRAQKSSQVVIDLVIVDLIMPEKDGLTLIRELKVEAPHVPIIAITGGHLGFHPDFGLETAAANGAARTLRKPVLKHELLAAVESVLNQRGEDVAGGVN